MSLQEFHAAIKDQNVPREHLAFRCPCCGTVQSAADLISAGAGDDFESVSRFLGFSCVGRFTGAGSPRKAPDGKPCNWTLGGLFQRHSLEVIDEHGVNHPHFEPVTESEAKNHMLGDGGAA
jgi:hypothetical protein